MAVPLSQDDKIRRGAADSGRYFRHMLDFVGFTPEDARSIRQTALVIEKHIPTIVAEFYDHLLRYPPTRKHFLKKDGSMDRDYIQKRMFHLSNFWRRTASGEYDDEYARYIDYVGRAHTSHGADPNIYIAERYVIGQVGFVQHAITNAINTELGSYDPELEDRAAGAWNKLMMVILEMLARAYREEHEAENYEKVDVDAREMRELAVEAYERGLGLERPVPRREVWAARAADIPEGERKIVEIEGLSIGIFRHKERWIALHNHCLHRGGPVCTGPLEGDVLVCPWHGYKYDINSGRLLVDPGVRLEGYPVVERDGELYVNIPVEQPDDIDQPLAENEFYARDLAPGQIRRLQVDGQNVAVYNVDGAFYATQEACTHMGGPLSEGDLEGSIVTCPIHGACFDVTSGAVSCPPAQRPLQTYTVTLLGEVVQVETRP